MLNHELFGFQHGLQAVGDLSGEKFTHAVLRNHSRVESAIKILRNKPGHPDIDEYQEKVNATLLEFCAKDDKGEPILEKGNYTGLEDNEEFNKAREAVDKEYQRVLDQDDKNKAEFKEELQEESDIEVYMLERKNIPDAITVNQRVAIKFMLKDPDSESGHE